MANTLDREALEREVALRLGPLGLSLDLDLVERFAEEIRSGRASASGNRVTGAVEPLGDAEVDRARSFSPDERACLVARGEAALAGGEVACAVLNGGMATRFGGRVKGIVEALGGRSFLEIKLAQARRHPRVAFLVMNSFATHAATLEFLGARELVETVTPFLQGVSLRLTPGGEVFRDGRGAVSLYAPGHGDFPAALGAAGLLESLARDGVRAILLSNVDNLGAEPDPLVLGYHFERGHPITCELARVRAGDVGGAPVRLDAAPQILEGFRFPEGYDFARNGYFATNTYVFSLEVLAAAHPLTWFFVTKDVEGRRAVQMEHLVNELTAHAPTGYLATPRDGPDGRFFPVKTPADLEALRADRALAARFAGLF